MSIRPSDLPCASCPWRINQTAESILNYNSTKACGLLNTVGEEDAFRPIMACYLSHEEASVACRGYLARCGWSNLNVRMLLAQGFGIPDPSRVAEACEDAGITLHATYAEVLAKLERRP